MGLTDPIGAAVARGKQAVWRTDRVVLRDVFVMFTMDCEPARKEVTAHGLRMSASGPVDYEESERSIRAHCATVSARGFPTTLFVHPEIAVNHRDLLLQLQEQGACLGLHLHPYKLDGGAYKHDLGFYSASEQRQMFAAAVDVWETALGQKPLYFRAGYFSANDSTFGVLRDLGFRGGSLSLPGRVLPEHCSIWAGAEPYPHRAHLSFRQLAGDGCFVEVPVSAATSRPVEVGAAGERGYEWLYIPADIYDHEACVRSMLERFRADSPRYAVIVTDTHNDQDYSDPGHPASLNLALILDCLESFCGQFNVRAVGSTIGALCDLVLLDDANVN